ncbi:nucleoside hydrolase [Histomonas meleagridis]|uniref:nucleoside hydrolase n=1 Tax=Histomonas meleagridis TaxID=135588 RepID=UPI0035594F12|nr:nucleoside hydrolase [Histomonas meleagridis]KAH0802604.1 nucleoside hydrolase [Histomonas meleagridis]
MVEYTTECLEISPDEMKRIQSITPEPVAPVQLKPVNEKIKVIIDTDFGTDLDDALALLYAVRTKELEILGVTTMYGPSKVRAAIIKKFLSAQLKTHPNFKPFEVIAGAETQTGTHREIFLSYKEGIGILSKKEIEELGNAENWGKGNQYEASEFIAKTVKEHPHEVTIASIGIPTNIALAIQNHPEIIPLIKEIVLMGCGHPITTGSGRMMKYKKDKKDWANQETIEFPWGTPDQDTPIQKYIEEGHIIHFFPNHNISGDSMATSIIFSHPEIKCRILSSFVTHNFWLEGKAIAYLKNIAKNVTPEERNNPSKPEIITAICLDEWFEYREGNCGGQCPHDPLTLHEIAFQGKDSHVVYLPGTMIIHEWAAFGTFVPHKNGNHLLGVDIVNCDEFLQHLTEVLIKED